MSSLFSNIHILENRKNSKEPDRQAAILDWLKKTQFRYLIVLLLVTLATIMDAPFNTRIAPTNLAMLYLVAVVVSAAYLGRGPAILASVLGVLAFDFFFVPPYLTFRVNDAQYLIVFAVLLAVGLLISELTARAHEQADAADQREKETAVLYALGRDLTNLENISEIDPILGRHIRLLFGMESRLLFVEQMVDTSFSPGLWKFPLYGSDRSLGMLEVHPANIQQLPTPDQNRLLEAFTTQAAQAIERLRLAKAAQQVRVLEETERLQSTLLNSISNDLRTPLVTITGSLSTLREGSIAMDSELHGDLVDTAYQEAGRLNRLVANLLLMTRLETGTLKINKQLEDIQDVIGAAIEPLNERLGSRPLHTHLQPGTPLISVDSALLANVLTNLVENAIQYSPEGSPVDILVFYDNQNIEVRVEDRGKGIPDLDLERIFDRFSRIQRSMDGMQSGTGLGLFICKGIVEAHGGSIWAENRPGGGTVLRLLLPIQKM